MHTNCIGKGLNMGELLNDKQWAHYGNENRLQAKQGQGGAEGVRRACSTLQFSRPTPAMVPAWALLQNLRHITCGQYLFWRSQDFTSPSLIEKPCAQSFKTFLYCVCVWRIKVPACTFFPASYRNDPKAVLRVLTRIRRNEETSKFNGSCSSHSLQSSDGFPLLLKSSPKFLTWLKEPIAIRTFPALHSQHPYLLPLVHGIPAISTFFHFPQVLPWRGALDGALLGSLFFPSCLQLLNSCSASMSQLKGHCLRRDLRAPLTRWGPLFQTLIASTTKQPLQHRGLSENRRRHCVGGGFLKTCFFWTNMDGLGRAWIPARAGALRWTPLQEHRAEALRSLHGT